MNFRIKGLLAASLLLIATGCTQSTTSETVSPELLASYQNSLALAAEPDQAVSVLEVRELLGGGANATADEDDVAHHADDGHLHGTDDAGHLEHPERDADVQAAAPDDRHEHDTDSDEHAEHDGHEHEEHAHAHDDHAHDHDHGHLHGAEGHPVVMVGKIGGVAGGDGTLSDFPWEKGRATFIISDPSFEPAHDHEHEHDHGHEHSHDDHECHFCQTAAIDAQAWVRFLGEDNKPLAVDTRDLFDVKEGDIVVVKGHAKLSAGLLVVDAQGMYVRR